MMSRFLKSLALLLRCSQIARRRQLGTARTACLGMAQQLESRQLLSAVTLEIQPSEDTSIYENNPDASNGQGEFLIVGDDARSLIRFDLEEAGVPRGSTVIDAVLTMNLDRPGSEPVEIELFRVFSAWGEDDSDAFGDEANGAPAEPKDATWNNRLFHGGQWDTPGGDFDSDLVSSAAMVTRRGDWEWFGNRLVDDIQAWVDDASANFGWIVTAAEEKLAFISSDSNHRAVRPRLELTYEVPQVQPAIVEGRLWNDVNGDGRQIDQLLSDLQLGMVNGSTHFNAFGGNEHWFRSAVNNHWYFLTPEGGVTQWSNQTRKLSGTFMGMVDPIYHDQPGLVERSRGEAEPWLNGWTVELLDANGEVLQSAVTAARDMNNDGSRNGANEGGWYRFEVTENQEYTIRQVIPEGWKEGHRILYHNASGQQEGVSGLDLRFNHSWYQNLGGRNEKWLYSDQHGWYFIVPDGRLYRWDGQTIQGDGSLSGVLIDTLTEEHWEDPGLLSEYQPENSLSYAGTTRIDFGNEVTFLVQGQIWLDVDGQGTRNNIVHASATAPSRDPLRDGETWLFDEESGTWFIIDVDGHPRPWGHHSEVDISANPVPGPVQTVEPWLNNQTVELVDEDGNVVATTLTQNRDLNGDGIIQFATERGWYVFEDVDRGKYTVRTPLDDSWEQTAPVKDPQSQFIADLELQLGTSDYFNYGGLSERWLTDGDGVWYYILPTGFFYAWDGISSPQAGLQGALIAQLHTRYYDDLELLVNPPGHVRVLHSTINEVFFGHRKLLDRLLNGDLDGQDGQSDDDSQISSADPVVSNASATHFVMA